MENFWQTRCSPALQSSTMLMASSSLQEFENQNQMGLNNGYHFHPNVAQDSRSSALERKQDSAAFFNIMNESGRSGHVDPESSFLALLSGSPSLLYCDFQELSNSKPSSAFYKLPPDSNTAIDTAVRGGIFLNPGGQPEKYPSNHMQNVADICPASRATVNLICNGEQDLQNSDPAKAAFHDILPGSLNLKDFSLKKELHSSILSTAGKPCSKNIQSPQSSTFMSGCPRVSCFTKSGYLLLGNNGLLGIVCSCHRFHMSVFKFCEHSGLCDVNPGDVVRMDSGETIAQWCKNYLKKFGIRVPEDHREWDWPEGLSATSILGNSSVGVTNMSNNKFSNLVGSTGEFVCSGQCLDDVMLPQNPHPHKNLVTDALKNKQPKNLHDRNSFLLKDLIGTSKGNLHTVMDNQSKCPVSWCSTESKFAGRGNDNCCLSASGYIDPFLKSGNLSVTHPTLQNLRILVNDSDISNSKMRNGGLVGGAATSSNIELRLGQPYQQSQASGNLAPLLFLEKLNCNTSKCSKREECGQYFHHAAVQTNLNMTNGSQLNLGEHAFGPIETMHASRQGDLRGIVSKSNEVSALRSFHTLPEGCAQSKARTDMRIMPEALHFESNAAKYNPDDVPSGGSTAKERQLNVSELAFNRIVDKEDKVVGFLANRSYIASESGFRVHNQREGSSSISGTIGICRPNYSAIRDKSLDPHHLSTVQLETSNARYLFNSREGVPSLGSMQSHTVSAGFPSAASRSTFYQTPTSTRQEGFGVSSHLPDENLRFLGVGQVLASSEKQEEFSLLGMNQDCGRFVSSLDLQNVLVDATKSNEQRDGPFFTKKQDVYRVAYKSLQSEDNCRVDGYMKKLVPMTGPTDFYNLSNTSNGNLVSPSHQESSLRNENSRNRQSEHGQCCQRVPFSFFQENCSFADGMNYLRKDGCFPSPFEKQMEVDGKASFEISSAFAEGHSVIEDMSISCIRSSKFGVPLAKNGVHHSSQWRDVPNKVKGASYESCVNQSANVADKREPDECHLGDINGALQKVSSLKSQEVSNVSPGSSAPAVTQASIKVNNVDSSFVDAADTGFGSNVVVDEGSSVDKRWTSDDSLESERSAEFFGTTFIGNSRKEGSYKSLDHHSSRSLLDELKLIDSLTWKKPLHQVHCGHLINGKTDSQRFGGSLKLGKRKREMKLGVLNASITKPDPSLAHQKNRKCTMSPTCSPEDPNICTSQAIFDEPDSNYGSYKLSSMITRFRKRRRDGFFNDREGDGDCQDESNGIADRREISKVIGRKKIRKDHNLKMKKCNVMEDPSLKDGKRTGYQSVGLIEASSCRMANLYNRKQRPVVCGEYGEISYSDMVGEMLKPAKIVSLNRVLKNARRCTLLNITRPSVTPVRELKKTSGNNVCYKDLSDLRHGENNSNGAKNFYQVDLANPEEETVKASSDTQCAEDFAVLENKRDDNSNNDFLILDINYHTHLKHKSKEIRKRSINELIVKGKCSPDLKERNWSENAENSKLELCKAKAIKFIQEQKSLPFLDSDAFCCVCGSSSKDHNNYLLECCQCSIRVHQACYGVSKVPKSCWNCRPCRASSKDIACVLCGYGGGAMTRALRSHTIGKSLLKTWNVETECTPKNMGFSAGSLQNEPSALHSTGAALEIKSLPRLQCLSIGESTKAVGETNTQNKLDTVHNSFSDNCLKMRNSITAGMVDLTVKQWVHMVCGLWTPGTRCPNVDTMSAFDVSGVASPKANVVCSICNRRGGSCIHCRVVNCSIQFHPWCAHEKGLLQSEVEGVDNENVGFYGRCIHHAIQHAGDSGCDPIDIETSYPEKEFTCARTEVYKGHKLDGCLLNINSHSEGKGILVPPEQLNAWVHINGQKSCVQGLPRLPISDIEHDCRKEYIRCKQAKGWKHLVVYKSGIHALGLYTSRFILRGEMVVEYVGEIVGLRVADKRENEYQFGRRLQYESACYFFRIDKEHIIDATRRGGIARFVNHSCLPNCVAKVISVRNEKKVVFLAERDIFPGEEITYDYHFNNEDEGKKIPCLCNSRNCRRYLN